MVCSLNAFKIDRRSDVPKRNFSISVLPPSRPSATFWLSRLSRPWKTVRNQARLRPAHFRAGAKIMAKSNLRLVQPNSELRTVALRRRTNRDMRRDREHLTEHEVERLIKVARGNRYGQRDATMILIGFRHGLRVSELCGLQWSSVEFETATMHVRRAKGGQEATHPLLGDELRALRDLKRQSASPLSSPRSAVARSPLRASPSCSPAPATKPRLVLGPSTHAPACLRLRTGQQGHRYPNAAGLSRPSLDQLDHALRRASPRPVQKHLGQGVDGSRQREDDVAIERKVRHARPSAIQLAEIFQASYHRPLGA
jgi:integrase